MASNMLQNALRPRHIVAALVFRLIKHHSADELLTKRSKHWKADEREEDSPGLTTCHCKVLYNTLYTWLFFSFFFIWLQRTACSLTLGVVPSVSVFSSSRLALLSSLQQMSECTGCCLFPYFSFIHKRNCRVPIEAKKKKMWTQCTLSLE